MRTALSDFDLCKRSFAGWIDLDQVDHPRAERSRVLSDLLRARRTAGNAPDRQTAGLNTQGRPWFVLQPARIGGEVNGQPGLGGAASKSLFDLIADRVQIPEGSGRSVRRRHETDLDEADPTDTGDVGSVIDETMSRGRLG